MGDFIENLAEEAGISKIDIFEEIKKIKGLVDN